MRASVRPVSAAASPIGGRLAAATAWLRGRPDGLCLFLLVLLPAAFLAPLLVSGRLIYGDLATQHIPFWRFTAQELGQGRFPFWDPYIYAGFPHAASPIPAVFYPATWLAVLLPVELAARLIPVLPCSLSGAFLFAHLRDQGVSRYAAFVGGLLAALSGGLNAQLGHVGIAAVAGWLPAALYLTYRWLWRRRLRYLWLLAGVVILQATAGHPQIFVYALIATAAYALFVTLASGELRAVPAGFAPVVAALLLGIGLSAFFLLPAAELARESSRAAASYEFFSLDSYPPYFVLTLASPWLFGGMGPFTLPYWGPPGPWWEMVQYLGVLALPLLAIAAQHGRADPRVRAYGLLAALLFVLAMGAYTPLHRLLYFVPVYNSFRLSARYVVLLGPVLAALVAFGLDYLRARRFRWAPLLATFVVVAGVLAIGCMLADLFARDAVDRGLARLALSRLGPASPQFLWPGGVLLVGLPLLIGLAHPRRPILRGLCGGLLLVLLFIDQGSFAWVFHGSLRPTPLLPSDAVTACTAGIRPPATLDRVDRAAYAEYVDAPPPERCAANYFLLAGVSAATGYDSLAPQRYLELFDPDGYGQKLRAESVQQHAPLLDLLGIRYLLASAISQETAGRLTIAPHQAVRARLGPVRADRLELVSWLNNGDQARQDEPVAEIRLTGADGAIRRLPVLAGVHTSEWAWDRPASAGPPPHRRVATVADFPAERSDYQGHAYRAEIALGEAVDVGQIEIVSRSDRASLVVDRLSLVDSASGRSVPLASRDLLPDTGTYTELMRRGGVVVWENGAALPRSWLVGETRVLPAAAVRAALLGGALPDGGRFDPRRLALLEDADDGVAPRSFGDRGTVDVLAYEPGRLVLRVTGAEESFVVVSESYYPGWRAQIEGEDATLLRVDYTLMGLRVPAGSHTAVLWYEPAVFARGAAVTAGVALAGLLVTWFARRRRAPGARAGFALQQVGQGDGERP